MVYRSSRRQAERDSEPEAEALQEFSAENRQGGMDKPGKLRREVGMWRTAAIILTIVAVGLLIAVVVLVLKGGSASCEGGRCGSKAKNPNFVDLSEPAAPGPFHDLTKNEIAKIREFITKDPKIKAIDPEKATMSSSYMYMMDLFPPKKADVLGYLDKKGAQPERQARVIMYRGDLAEPMVEEYACGPLPDVTSCSLIKSDKRRNPVEFALRPVSIMEFGEVFDKVLTQVDKKLGYMLREVYGASYTNCQEPMKCFNIYPSPMGTGIVSDITQRRLWVWAEYPLEYYALHPVDFGVLANLDGSDSSKFSVDKLWFAGKLYDNMEQLATFYNSSKGSINKLRAKKASNDLFSSMHLRSDPLPGEPLRPPTLVEPDGIRYTLKDRKVDYQGWSFNFRMSALTGPALYDIRYRGERIAYEVAMNEIAVFYSANNPLQRITDFVDSGALIGTHSKSMVPGGDCPESATFVNQTFSGQTLGNTVEIPRAFCLFENNNGYPIRRHLSYSQAEGGFYNGMLDSVLTLRSALTVVNYDYIVDFIFHQNGVMESRIMSTGYIFPSFYREEERPYGFQIAENLVGSLHHHIFHYKVDADISGTSNRYETLDITSEAVELRAVPGYKYYQTRFDRKLKKTEKEALYKFNFDTPKYHVVHNEAVKTDQNEIKAFRIGLHAMSKQLHPEGVDNEKTIPWARHQLAVTKHKDDEVISSSPYAMWDSYDPVTDFSEFYEDDESIVDEDLVFWITMGMHHIPHTEDLPVTPTVGNHLTFFLFPYNYFKECPSMKSRDQMRIELKDRSDPTKGVRVERYGRGDGTCSLPPYSQEYDKVLEDDPDTVLESRKVRGLF